MQRLLTAGSAKSEIFLLGFDRELRKAAAGSVKTLQTSRNACAPDPGLMVAMSRLRSLTAGVERMEWEETIRQQALMQAFTDAVEFPSKAHFWTFCHL
eukprot:6477189-Amphidinium_carterae.2